MGAHYVLRSPKLEVAIITKRILILLNIVNVTLASIFKTKQTLLLEAPMMVNVKLASTETMVIFIQHSLDPFLANISNLCPPPTPTPENI